MLWALAGAGQKQRNVDRVLDSCVKKGFNGAVLIARKGKMEYLRYTGLANRENNIAFSTASRFHIFSVTKTFTAVLILQLYEQHRICLDSPIRAYYPAYMGEARNKVTIRNLLTYSSGRDPKEMKDVLDVYSNNIWGVDTFIAKYCSEKLIDTPGVRFNYTNGDFIILGKIIENICGRPYEEVLREKILRPLGMSNTNLLHHRDIIQGMADGYATEDSCSTCFHRPTNYYIDNLYSAGAMYSTPEDLLVFDRAVFHHTILRQETVNLMLTPFKNLGDVALGFWVYPRTFGSVHTLFAERQGGGYGFHSNWVHLIDQDLTFIFLANTESVDLNQMRLDVIGAYLK